MGIRIKKDVDLKELEKFGFKKIKRTDIRFSYFSYVNEKATMEVSELCNRIIDCDSYWECIKLFKYQDLLYDLIQANLVEKVEE